MPTFIAKNDQQIGPFEDAEIIAGMRQGIYSSTDLCWREGMTDWQPLSTLYAASTPVSPPALPPSVNVPPLPVQKNLGDDAGIRFLLPVGRSAWAIAAGYLGLFAVLLLPAPFAIFTAAMAIRDIRRSRNDPHPKHGMGRAVFGMIMGVLGTGILLFIAVGMLLDRH